MFGENGFCHEGAYSTEPNESQNGGAQMNYQNKEMAHAQSYQFVIPGFQANLEFAMDSFSEIAIFGGPRKVKI